MAISGLSNSSRSMGLDGWAAALDVGSTDPSADLRIGTSGLATILGELTFTDASTGALAAAVDGVAQANPIDPEDAALDDGTAAAGQVRDCDNAQVFLFTVGGSGSSEDLRLSNTSITAGDIISIGTFQVTFPAG